MGLTLWFSSFYHVFLHGALIASVGVVAAAAADRHEQPHLAVGPVTAERRRAAG